MVWYGDRRGGVVTAALYLRGNGLHSRRGIYGAASQREKIEPRAAQKPRPGFVREGKETRHPSNKSDG
jgi:hypothetical protein